MARNIPIQCLNGTWEILSSTATFLIISHFVDSLTKMDVKFKGTINLFHSIEITKTLCCLFVYCECPEDSQLKELDLKQLKCIIRQSITFRDEQSIKNLFFFCSSTYLSSKNVPKSQVEMRSVRNVWEHAAHSINQNKMASASSFLSVAHQLLFVSFNCCLSPSEFLYMYLFRSYQNNLLFVTIQQIHNFINMNII